MDYVTSGSETGKGHRNPFGKLHQGDDDREALIVHRARYLYLVLNRYPYNPGHLLIVPYREVAALKDLEREERIELMDLIIYAQDLIQGAMQPAGFNVGFNFGKAGGAGIPSHLHCHVVPRWEGDSNFLPVIGETRSLPQALDKTWEVLMKSKKHA